MKGHIEGKILYSNENPLSTNDARKLNVLERFSVLAEDIDGD